MKRVLITGSAGLIGSEATAFFCKKGFDVFGIDNNMRAYFFGKDGSTIANRKRLKKTYTNYTHITADIRDERKIRVLFKQHHFDLIIHAAAQPSHDWSATDPLTDFSINATATLLLLEQFRTYSPDAVFIFTSTNKVYGDSPNMLPLVELETRYELPQGHRYYQGIDESMGIDNCIHSVFGASKTAADVMVQEYGKYFRLKTAVFRGGCLTGPTHAGAKLHGFLSYLVKCIATGKEYTINGYKGKQVRDNIHAFDLVNAFYQVYKRPVFGEVYNIGGSRHSNTSVLEAITKIETVLGKKAAVSYTKEHRIGDHKWYISDVSKFKKQFPGWTYTYSADTIIEDICRNGGYV